MRVLRAVGVLLTAVLAAGCAPGAEAPPEHLVLLVEDLDAFWQDELGERLAELPEVVVASEDAPTGCGAVEDDDGSFYCGADGTVYLHEVDLQDLRALPRAERSAQEEFLLAHEYGHHVQDQLAVDEGEVDRGPDSTTVRYELQADCLAGAWLGAVVREEHLAAVREAGDDAGEDPLPPAEFEHGSSEQRLEAFQRGADDGAQACLAPAAG